MSKYIKKIVFSFIVICFLFIVKTKVYANSINNIDMDIYINQNGNATITEIWNAYLNEGTEGYRPYSKLGNSVISNFSVTDDSGKEYEFLSKWDINGSFKTKAYKCGINNTTSGKELCWGISNYGNRTYTLKYNISNLVTQYTDVQGIYFNFLNLKQPIGNAKITIHSDIPFSLDNARIWAFGNNGNINFKNGKIVLDSEGTLSANQYMVALVRLNSNLFNTANKSNNSFQNIYDSAFEGVTNNNYSQKNNTSVNEEEELGFKNILYLLGFLPLMLLFNPFILIIILFFIVRKKMGSVGYGEYANRLDFGQDGKELPKDDEINYWRDIPCNKDLGRAYWVCYQYNIVKEDDIKPGIIGAIFLKWIKNGNITVSKTKKGLFSFKDNNYALDLTQMTGLDNEIEKSLFNMLILAAGHNRILEAKEFSKWSKKNWGKIYYWFPEVRNKVQTDLEKQGLITATTQEVEGAFGRKKNVTVKQVGPQLREDAIQMKGLKKFLLDYSMMPEKEYFEVHIWEEYLIFANLLGIADKVEEQFSKLYPKFKDETVIDTDVTAVVARNMAEICIESVREGHQASITRASEHSSSSSSSSSRDRDSGGGGSSYSGGGSSAGGSSGGGFR